MYQGKKKAITIIIIVVVVVLLAILGGGAFLFFTTDMFKSEQTLFYKYLGQGLGQIKVVENTQLSNYKKMKEQKPYNVTGSVTASYLLNNQEDTTSNKTDIVENLRLHVTGKVDEAEGKSNFAWRLDNGTQPIFTVDFTKSNNIYAFYAPEIVTNYIGVRGDNLPINNGESALPESVPTMDIVSLLQMSEEERNNINTTYGTVLQENIAADRFQKQSKVNVNKAGKSYTANSYRLDLSGNEVKALWGKILTTLKQDSVTLNLLVTKAKLLGLGETYTQVNNLTQYMQDRIDNIDTELEKVEDGISMIVYEAEGETILTEVIIKNQVKISIDNMQKDNGQTFSIKFENLGAQEDYESLSFAIETTFTATQTATKITIDMDEKSQIEMTILNEGQTSLESMKNTYNVSITTEKNIVSAEYIEEVKFVDSIEDIISLNGTNCGILNDYPKEQVTGLTSAILFRTIEVVTEKLNTLGLLQEEVITPNTDNQGENDTQEPNNDNNTDVPPIQNNVSTNTTEEGSTNTQTSNTVLPIVITQ